MILLDTDVAVDIIREFAPAVQWLSQHSRESFALPGISAMELIQGARNRNEQIAIENALEGFLLVWPTPQVCEEAFSVFSRFYLSHGLGILDSFIGLTAISMSLPLQTFNQKHYAVIPGLQTVQPYARV